MKTNEIYEVYEWLERFYHYILMYSDSGHQAKSYLLERGLSNETLKKFKLGFAPKKAKITLEFLESKGYNLETLVSNKVLNKFRDGNITDIFRGRIVLPIQDFKGRTVAFGGRSVDGKSNIKYINSATSNVYQKKDNLYGFSRSEDHIKKEGFAILVEGYFDVLVSHQNGLKNTVGALGTALTVNQALLIKSITENVVIAFDGDDAGMENAFRSASVLASVGCKVKIATIPNELDPDDYISTYGGTSFLKDVIHMSKDVIVSYIEYKSKRFKESTSPLDRFVFIEDVLKNFPPNNESEHIKTLSLLGEELNVDLGSLYNYI